MNVLDWIVLVVTLVAIIAYGMYKSRTTRDLDGYLLANRKLPWYVILVSIMGTQASAITFISAPGQAYTDGMRFVQYYFGLPLAAIVICISFIPVFNRLKVYTAYEYLESRFDLKTRAVTSFLFLLQRGLSTGISVFAPSIILSLLFGWNIYVTILLIGGLLIIYTVAGGAKAVAHTQKIQFLIIIGAMLLAAFYIFKKLPKDIGLNDALSISGKLGKLNIITTGIKNGQFDWGDRYNIFSGILGSFFFMLSYFGTDQTQVGRYLTGKNVTESRLGLLMNGIVKVPMQFFILMVGVLIFTFYQFNHAPAFFNNYELERLKTSEYKTEFSILEQELNVVEIEKKTALTQYQNHESEQALQKLQQSQTKTDNIRKKVKELVKKNNGKDNDTNYIFLHFVLDHIPAGLVGLIIAAIFLASWGSIGAALNSLASITVVDVHKRLFAKKESDEKTYRYSKIYSLLWGLFCIAVAMYISNSDDSLIEAVNILGSLFYGTILGIYLVAFYAKKVTGNAVFVAAILSEAVVIFLFILNESNVIKLGWLWLSAVGALSVVAFGMVLQKIFVGVANRKRE
jgi:Na+/proline symporter